MRLVIAVLRPSQLEAVRQALAAVHVSRLTVCDAQEHSLESGRGIAREAVLEIAVNEDFLARTVDTIRSVLAAGGPAAADEGGLFVMPVTETVQIYREVRGAEAV